MLKIIGVILILVGFAMPLKKEVPKRLIIWNVGQGQWLTQVSTEVCLHFDAGGELLPKQQVLDFCQNKPNFIWLSHSDWDHMSALPWIRAKLNPSCLFFSGTSSLKDYKRKILVGFLPCQPRREVKLVWPLQTLKSQQDLFKPSRHKTSANIDSAVYILDKTWLIPGDSPSFQEKRWANLVPSVTLSHLILGHHGSRTATSKYLLEHLPYLRQTIASARQRRYGHPHREVVGRLRLKGVAVISTEDWGHIAFAKR